MKPNLSAFFLLFPLLCCTQYARASGGPFAVDDAEIVDGCQLETGLQWRNSDTQLAYLAPGCTLAGIEFTLAASRLVDAGQGENTVALQGKWVLRAVDELPGLALTLGTQSATRSLRAEELFANLALSHDLGERLRINANLGSARNRELGKTRRTWGLGVDVGLKESLNLILERYSDGPGSPQETQLGLRTILPADGLHVDWVLGRNLQGIPGKWLGAGLVWEFR